MGTSCGTGRLLLAAALLAATIAFGGVVAERCRAQEAPVVGIDFISRSRGWVVLGGESVLITRDGGDSWRVKELTHAFEAPSYQVAFWNRYRGCAVGGDGNAWRTTTGGRTWLHRRTGQSGEHIGLALLPPAQAWVTYAYVRDDDEHTESYSWLSTSIDGGDSWSPAPQVTAAGGALTDLDFVSETSGWGVGSQVVAYEDADGNLRGYNTALIAHSDDGGATWPTRFGPDELGITQRWSHLWAADFRGGLCGWAVGDAGRYANPRVGLILRTVDGGVTWAATTFDKFWSFLHVSMATTQVGWATADTAPSWKAWRSARNRILRTTDGGRTWRVQYLPRGLHAIDVDALSSTTAFVAGTSGSREDRGMVARTTDGGAHWVRVW